MITKYIKEAINECLKKKKSVYDKQKFIEECISNAVGNFLVNETNAIRPWRDDDYQKVNPFQVGDVSDEAYRNAPDGSDNAFKEPIRQGEIDDYQRELTQRIRQRSNTTQQPIKDYYREFNNLGRYKAIGNDTFAKWSDKANSCKANDINLKKGWLDTSVRGSVFSYGNKKLPRNTMIFNLTTAMNCPSKLCKFFDTCYAKAGDNKNINPALSGLRNQFMLKYITIKELLKLIEMYIEYAPMRIKRIRLSESGDFSTQKQVDVAKKLAAHLKKKYNIDTVVYTAQPFDFSGNELIVNASNEKVIGADRYFYARDLKTFNEMGIDMTEDLKIKYMEDGQPYYMCPCECRKCNFCYRTRQENGENSEKLTIVWEKLRGHGGKIIKDLEASRRNKAKKNKYFFFLSYYLL